MLREKLREILKENVCEAQFTKADGSLRGMMCTLLPTALPEKPVGTQQRAENLEVVPVWDMKAEGWRSFRLDSLKSFSIIDSEGFLKKVDLEQT